MGMKQDPWGWASNGPSGLRPRLVATKGLRAAPVASAMAIMHLLPGVVCPLDEVEITELLLAAGLLDELHRDNRQEIEKATARLIELLIVVENG